MKMIEKIKSSAFMAKIKSGDFFTKFMLLMLVIGVWAIFIENIVMHFVINENIPYVDNHSTREVKVVNTVSVSGEVDADVRWWGGHRVGSHEGYVDDNGYKHSAIDVYVDGGSIYAY